MPAANERGTDSSRFWLARHPLLGIFALWLALGSIVGLLSGQVRDWYVMTDELLYERLALGVVRNHTLLPHVNGEFVPNVAQLYPVVIAPVIALTNLPAAVHDAHIWNAYVMTSACIPTFLLARMVSRNLVAAYAAAILAAAVPWIVYSSFLLTEVAAYPAFVWAMLALTYCVQRPGTRSDLLAVGAIALAVLGRTQFLSLAVILPVVILLYEGLAESPTGLGRRLISTARAHLALVIAYGVGLVMLGTLVVSGRAWYLLGTYRQTTRGSLLTTSMPKLAAEHLAGVALGLTVIPFLVGAAWLLSASIGRDRSVERAFALTGLVTLTVLAFEVASFDLRFANDGTAHDRYFFYAAAIVLVASATALARPRRLGPSLLVVGLILAYGFRWTRIDGFRSFPVASPVSSLSWMWHDLFSKPGTALALITLALIPVLWLAGRTKRWALLTIVAAAALVIPVQTGYVFHHLYSVPDTAARSSTASRAGADWVDRTVGRKTNVTLIPYATAGSITGFNQYNVWNILFWNASVERSAYGDGRFLWYPSTFPSSALTFDPRTGKANVSLTKYVVGSDSDPRFGLAGHPLVHRDHFVLSTTDLPWRAAWVTSGTYADGWTQPGIPARIRLYPAAGQSTAQGVLLRLSVQAPTGTRRRFRAESNLGVWQGVGPVDRPVTHDLPVCVPAHGSTDVTLTAKGSTEIQGLPIDPGTQAINRRAGVQLVQIALPAAPAAC